MNTPQVTFPSTNNFFYEFHEIQRLSTIIHDAMEYAEAGGELDKTDLISLRRCAIEIHKISQAISAGVAK